MRGECSTYGAYEKLVHHFARKPEGKILHGRPRRRWKYSSKLNIGERVWTKLSGSR